MTDFDKNPEGKPKKLPRRNLLRNAAIKATSAVLLLSFLTGCHKETPKPGGGVGAEPDKWYVLKVTNIDPKTPNAMGYLAGISSDPVFSFYDYMQISASGWKFKVHPGTNGFDYWEISDGNYLSLRYNGWAYRAYESNKIGWKIVNGKLYNNYDRWKDYPIGCEYRSDLDLIPAAYYVGVGLTNNNQLNVEIVPAP
ncbi:MAG: hypothetical protein ABIN89_25195 [Chitinophagaceae bacterium]